MSFNLKILAARQLWRFIGFTFAWLEAHRRLPRFSRYRLDTATWRSALRRRCWCGNSLSLAIAVLLSPGGDLASRTFDGGDESAAVKPGANVSGAVVFQFSCDLYRAGEKLEERSKK